MCNVVFANCNQACLSTFLPPTFSHDCERIVAFGFQDSVSLFVCSVSVSMLLSHTVLSELYQETLVTVDEVNSTKRSGESLSFKIVRVQCTKPPEVVSRTAAMLDKYGLILEARQLRGWWGSQTTQQ